jgi:hypothetical protein
VRDGRHGDEQSVRGEHRARGLHHGHDQHVREQLSVIA